MKIEGAHKTVELLCVISKSTLLINKGGYVKKWIASLSAQRSLGEMLSNKCATNVAYFITSYPSH